MLSYGDNEKNIDDEKWENELGIKFSLATLDDIEELRQYMHGNFYREEPVMKCMRVSEGEGLPDKYGRHVSDKELVVDVIKKNAAGISCSIIARSTQDNSIVACRLGAIYNRHDNLDFKGFVPSWLGDLPSFVPIPAKVIHIVNWYSLYEDIHYSKCSAFAELENSDLIYFAECLSVSPRVRGKGLGAELVKRGYDIAEHSGCLYTYVLATSKYSQHIFHKLGNVTILHEVSYDDYRYDKKGRPFLLESGEHKVIQLLAIQHGK